ncbi:MAG TPA: GTPase domain-containing protein [Gemmataceae bacterium]|jgi:GTPase SAR1 family protein|nr:GTPase domain-containing protein [Gemmataceae bacterium]
MSEPLTEPIAAPVATRRALRIVLFGRTDAGKSSLLGALMQAAQTQEHVLNGHLTDLSQGLAELQRRLYEEDPHGTPQEVVPYHVAFEPFDVKRPGAAGRPVEAVLIDCDGQAANRLLERRQGLDGRDGQGSLARAVLDADALVLAVDGSASPAQVDADFAQFDHFLRLLEHSRGRLTEVTGLPVFLVLTKCDLLAGPDAKSVTFSDWVERIEAKKLKVAERFREFLSRARAKDPTPFGRIHLQQLCGTAVKRPALADSPARPRDPYGVAELFRQALADATRFRQRRDRSNRWLVRVIAGSIAVVAALVCLFGVFLFLDLQNKGAGPLEVQVDQFLAQDIQQTPARRHEHLQQDVIKLTEWMNDPAFAKMPQSTQDQVRRRLDELKAYQEYEAKLNQITDPQEAKNLAQLQEIATALTRVNVPPEYPEEWRQTRAGRRQADWLEDADAMTRAVTEVGDWYLKLARDGKQVLDNSEAANLPARAKKVLDKADKPPFPEKDPDHPLPGTKRATYAAVFAFDSVAEARRKWEEVRKKLEPFAKLEGP